ncbi:hypothetical protein FIBSPDRAFT_890205 [Athelia psychrophila]|uniref:Uncharacterized protein n=1 Tax=Athelia psychrophila TaxID=1759441 RepID=A0A166L4H2_9AGAM|nr:hypothetical protein FIBSPDRAFT_890205 [Fibularhizoctonia sp. CBS 109695]
MLRPSDTTELDLMRRDIREIALNGSRVQLTHSQCASPRDNYSGPDWRSFDRGQSSPYRRGQGGRGAARNQHYSTPRGGNRGRGGRGNSQPVGMRNQNMGQPAPNWAAQSGLQDDSCIHPEHTFAPCSPAPSTRASSVPAAGPSIVFRPNDTDLDHLETAAGIFAQLGVGAPANQMSDIINFQRKKLVFERFQSVNQPSDFGVGGLYLGDQADAEGEADPDVAGPSGTHSTDTQLTPAVEGTTAVVSDVVMVAT